MRRSELALGALVAALSASCETRLPGGDLGASAADAGAAPVPPVVTGCRPLHGAGGITRIGGAVRSLAMADGSILVVADDVTAAGADVATIALTMPAGAGVDDCLATASPAGPEPAFEPPGLAPLSGVVAAGVPSFYTADPAGGFGVAARDQSDGAFRRSGPALWTSDRPAFGTAAVASGGDVYAIGCTGARFLDADCYVARAPAASIADASAYEYATGSDRWSPRVEDAWPVTSGGTAADVAWLPAQSRWLFAYASPLGTTIRVRSGLSPAGPWSAAVDVATCDLADPDMFCVGVHLHPALASPAGTIALSYAPASFASDQDARRAADPDAWWPRLVALPLPALP